MTLRIVTILLSFVFICCKPKLVESAKDMESAEVRMELKNLWVLLEDYRSANGHFPRALSELQGVDHASLSKWDYTPNASPVIVRSIKNENGLFWLLSADGEIQRTLPGSMEKNSR
jgi:hypothetical protein